MYSRYEAILWVKEHFNELVEIVKEMRDNWEYDAILDIFDNTEKFMTSVYLWVASEICEQLESVIKFWYDSQELTAEHIPEITAELEQIAEQPTDGGAVKLR